MRRKWTRDAQFCDFFQPHRFPGLDRGSGMEERHWLKRRLKGIRRGEMGLETQERMNESLRHESMGEGKLLLETGAC